MNDTECPVKPRPQNAMLVVVGMVLAFAGTIGQLQAHDLWIIASPARVTPGHREVVRLVLGHNFPQGSLLPPARFLSVAVTAPDGRSSALKTAPAGLYQRASFTPSEPGAYLVTASFRSYLTFLSPTRWFFKPKDEVNGTSVFSQHVSKDAKTIIGAGGNAFEKRFGFTLEIVPLRDPASLRAGDLLPVQVFFEGKPLDPGPFGEIEIRAVYAGFQWQPDTWAVAGDLDRHGICNVKLVQPGLWMVMTERIVPRANRSRADADDYISTLTFHVAASEPGDR